MNRKVNTILCPVAASTRKHIRQLSETPQTHTNKHTVASSMHTPPPPPTHIQCKTHSVHHTMAHTLSHTTPCTPSKHIQTNIQCTTHYGTHTVARTHARSHARTHTHSCQLDVEPSVATDLILQTILWLRWCSLQINSCKPREVTASVFLPGVLSAGHNRWILVSLLMDNHCSVYQSDSLSLVSIHTSTCDIIQTLVTVAVMMYTFWWAYDTCEVQQS